MRQSSYRCHKYGNEQDCLTECLGTWNVETSTSTLAGTAGQVGPTKVGLSNLKYVILCLLYEQQQTWHWL